MTYFIDTHRRTYLSIAVGRALSADHPVGDPFGGPAYGRREMPVVAVAAAAYAGAGLALGTIALASFAGIAAVGSIMAGVGVLTGNKNLVKVGGVLGLAGAVGSWGATAANFSDGQALWDDPFKAAGNTGFAGTGPEVASQQAIDGSAETINAAAQSTAPDITQNISNTELEKAAVVEQGGVVNANSPVVDSDPAKIDPVAAADANAAGINAGDGQWKGAPGLGENMVDNWDPALQGRAPPAPANGPFGSKLFENTLKWAEKNQTLAGSGLRFIEGALGSYGAKGDLMSAQTALYQARADTENAQLANSNYVPDTTKYFSGNKPTAPAVYKPAVYKPTRAGLINA